MPESKPAAWLKEWLEVDKRCIRVDLTLYCEPWLIMRNPKITPLFESPKPPEGDPAIYQETDEDGNPICDDNTFSDCAEQFEYCRPLYDHPPTQPRTMTDEEIIEKAKFFFDGVDNDTSDITNCMSVGLEGFPIAKSRFLRFARALLEGK